MFLDGRGVGGEHEGTRMRAPFKCSLHPSLGVPGQAIQCPMGPRIMIQPGSDDFLQNSVDRNRLVKSAIMVVIQAVKWKGLVNSDQRFSAKDRDDFCGRAFRASYNHRTEYA